ncbi:MAG: hypothetical protein WAM14_14500 [Candidatus Nitrosopolaris sp.]
MKGGRITNYRYRWIFEGVFSSMKRIFGDYVSARKFSNMTKELMIKASLSVVLPDMVDKTVY